MQNRDIYLKDPSTHKLVNEGVASVNDDPSNREALNVLRYELETFVCDGQYEKGMEHILRTFIDNINKAAAQQPGVWISGFYGSGKSHLAKMLRALWVDTRFEDGATARGLANLSSSIRDLLKELDTQAKRFGGVQAASGTLGAGASGSVRLALLNIVFKSVGLPAQYPVARFIMWLKSEGIYDDVYQLVEQNGYDWLEELDNFYVAEGLHQALVALKPGLFSSPAICVETLNNLYPHVADISSDEMVKALRQALSRDGKLPLTLIVLDEVQQYIGEDSQRSLDVQEAVEACSKNIGGRLLFIGTGQTAVTGTSNLKKLEGRFTVRVELSDADVEAVIRQVILAKKPDAINAVQQVMQSNLGEISRHLAGTSIGHRMEDITYFSQDYPVLPVRRRFWENSLRVLDSSGTDSQLRNQLSLVHKVIQTNLDQPIGYAVPADFIYYDLADRLLQARILPRNVYDMTMTWSQGSPDERLMARACGLVFLINKLAGNNMEIGIQANVDTIADLMVDDLTQGSATLRSKLPALLDSCALLIKVKDEYRIQTKESAAWNDEFQYQRSQLANSMHLIDAQRDQYIRQKFNVLVKKLSLTQGASKVSRDLTAVFDSQLPADSDKKVCVWVRDEWSIDENSFRVEARQAGNQSPTIYVFIPKGHADELRHQLMDAQAAISTLNNRSMANGAEGNEARAYMETTRLNAESRINELLEESFAQARVFQSGGQEISGGNLQETILEAARNSLQRLYRLFAIADHDGWGNVYSHAQKGAPDALKYIAFENEVSQHPVCKTVLSYIAGGKKGADIRGNFEEAPYGWSRDAVDGSLQVLMVAGVIRAQDENGKSLDPKKLERKQIGKTAFKIEAATVSAPQRLQVRKLLQMLGFQCNQGEEAVAIPDFLAKLKMLAQRAGGEEPKPVAPDCSFLEEIRLVAGNEQIVALYNSREEIGSAITQWTALAEQVEKRWPSWQKLQTLLTHGGNKKGVEEAGQQAEAIKHGRLLLAEPDPIQPLLKSLEDTLRKELATCHQHFVKDLEIHMRALNQDESWSQLDTKEQESILRKCEISAAPIISLGTYAELLASLDKYPLQTWRDRTDALPGRFARAREMAAKAMEPEIQTVNITRPILKSEDDIEKWVNEIKEKLIVALSKGPVVIK